MFFIIIGFLRVLLFGALALWLLAGRSMFPRKRRELRAGKRPKGKKQKVRGLSEKQLEDYRKRIEDYLQSGTSHLSCDFRMRTMVEETGIPRHHLSAVINTAYHTNFNTFINKHRIGYILQHFNEPAWAHLSLEGVAQEAGFKSRSTFINAFKQVTGMTPSKFREHYKSSNYDKKMAIQKNRMSEDNGHHRFDRHATGFLYPSPGTSAGSA